MVNRMSDSYKGLDVWNISVKLVTEIYKIIEGFHQSEKFGLTNQIRRSAVSIPSNIAEGSNRFSEKDFARFLTISSGSVAELETQLIISNNLGFISNESLKVLQIEIVRISKMLVKLRKSLNKEANITIAVNNDKR